MRPILTVTTPATDLLLLTDAEARQAIGEAGAAADGAKVLQLRKAVSAAITSRCNVWASGAVPATLRLETLSQMNRLDCPVEQVRLVRRPVVEIVSVTEDGSAVVAADYELDASAGLLRRLCGDYPSRWGCLKVVVAYRAGWATVPDNLRAAAMKLATVVWSEAGRDSGLRSIEIPDVITKEYWVGPADDPLIAREIEELLADYINPLQA